MNDFLIDSALFGLPLMALPRRVTYSGEKLKAIRSKKKQERKAKKKNRK